VQSNLLKRGLSKQDFDVSGTISFAFSTLFPDKSRCLFFKTLIRNLRGILLQAGLFKSDYDVPLKEISSGTTYFARV
jgi:hypothetical protein